MNESFRKDLRIGLLIGLIAGILLLPTLRNLGVSLNLSTALLVIASLIVLTPLGYLFAYWLSRWFPVVIQFMKFSIVGGLNAMIDLGVLNLLIYMTGFTAGFYYSIFKGTSFVAAVINSYFWNKFWTFKATETGPGAEEFLKFLLVNLVGFSINVGAASIVVNIIGAPSGFSGELWANVGAVSAVFISLFWNFIGMKVIVFKR